MDDWSTHEAALKHGWAGRESSFLSSWGERVTDMVTRSATPETRDLWKDVGM